jgi:hypothetical protein
VFKMYLAEREKIIIISIITLNVTVSRDQGTMITLPVYVILKTVFIPVS